MKKFNWKEFMRTHLLFSSLNEMEIEEVLQEELSEEKEFPQGTLIVTEGEVKDTIFLIGSGSVQVVLAEKGGNETSLSILRRGEIFGEMAVLDKRPRSATVKANENCTLLEVKGREFLKILGDHPDIEFKILLKLSERLRVLNDHLLTIKVQDVDDKLKLFNSKLDAELKAVEAQLKAAQVVFDQTKANAESVIASTERSRTRITTISGLVGLVLMVLGFFGFEKFGNINEKLDKIDGLVKQAEELTQQAERDAKLIGKTKDEFKQAVQVSEKLNEIKQKVVKLMFLPSFDRALGEGENGKDEAFDLYLHIRSIEPPRADEMLNRILGKIVEQPDRDYTSLLGLIFEDATTAPEKFKAAYLYLANAILLRGVDPKTLRPYGVDETPLRSLDYVQKNKGRVEKTDLASMDTLFQQQDKQKKEAFERIKQFIVRR